ncbi:MAG: zeta toxin family protein [Oscillospiraceae bacterium]|nr:zeta toxin family protein [Oscillospiraceae bacterium]
MPIKPKIVVFAGPNGSGKSTITDNCNISGKYINADIIQQQNNYTTYDAAVYAESLREACLSGGEDFTFETVLSTTRNLELLKRAKDQGYFIRGFYVLTCSVEINVLRVHSRVKNGGHDVPEDKIRKRYTKALQLLPQFIDVCDICSVYDNSLDIPCRIYKKYHGDIYQANEVWTEQSIKKLVNGTYI